MEVIPINPLLVVTRESVKKVRQLYAIDDVKRINASLDIIEDWLKKQPHLADAAEYMDRMILEQIFIRAKGSTEKAKNILEKFLTCREMIPDIALHRSMCEFEIQHQILKYVPLPKLHPDDQSRVMLCQFVSDDLDRFSLLAIFRYAFMLGDYRWHHDYTCAERYIIDLRNTHAGLLKKINPVILKKAEVLSTEGFNVKIKGIHFLNASTFLDKLIYILKRVLKEKIANRIHAHNSFEDLHKHVPKEILPKEYGGAEESVQNLDERWIKTLKGNDAMRLIKDADKMVSDESKRPKSKFNVDYLGMPGSFRTLHVD